MRFSLLWACLILSCQSLLASRPTVHASNFKASQITCISLQLNWVYGDGSARLIVAKEGSAPDWSPSDYNEYSADPNFGKGPDQNGNGNFIVYNAGGTNFVKVDSLKTGKTYYFTIYEHDNNKANTLYYTGGTVPTVSATTYVINMQFNITDIDSCEQHNAFRFINKSSTTIPGLSFKYIFGVGDSVACPINDSILHSYKAKYGQVPVRLNAAPGLGCLNNLTKVVRIYPKKNAYIDFTSFKDTMCLDGNKFVIDPQPLISPLPKSFTYNWNFGDGSPINTFKKMQYSYKTSGKFGVEVEIITNVNLTPTSCKDTLRFNVVVLPSPVGSASINDTFQCLKYNKFTFTNTDNSLTYFRWYFKNNNGDDDSALQQTFSYTFTKVGKDTIIHVAYAKTGCKGRDTVEIEILPNLNTAFSGLNSQYCTSLNPVTLTPVVPGGYFDGYALDAQNSFVPNQVGKFTLHYIITNRYCTDTTSRDFEVFQTPLPDLGPDLPICDAPNSPQILKANYSSGTYLWNTSETTDNITVYTPGKYWVDVTDGICKATDTVLVDYAFTPKVELGKDTSVCKGNRLELNAAYPKSTYLWQDGSTDSVLVAYTPGKYTVIVQNICGRAEDSVFVFFQTDYCDLFMANAFSPDNDLINSVYKPVGKNITVELFQIYNRWGQLVFSTDKDDVGWNGQYMGKPAPQDLYIWKLFYTTPSGRYIKKSNAAGTVMLLR